MKKITLFAVLTVIVAFLGSCSKDSASPENNGGGGGGTQTEGKKISKINNYATYTEETSYNNQVTWQTVDWEVFSLTNEWFWDGNKIGRIVSRYSDEDVENYVFSYNNSGYVSRITWRYHEEDLSYTSFYYNSSQKINKFEIYNNDILDEAYELTYSGEKPIRINCIYYSNNKASDQKLSFMRNFKHFNPTQDFLEKDDLPYVELTWTGNNITKIKEYIPDEGVYTCNYTYDDKNNPYYGGNALFAYSLYASSICMLSYNNVTLAYVSGDINTAYDYNYYENYPMQVSYTDVKTEYSTYDNAWHRYTSDIQTNYVYVTEE